MCRAVRADLPAYPPRVPVPRRQKRPPPVRLPDSRCELFDTFAARRSTVGKNTKNARTKNSKANGRNVMAFIARAASYAAAGIAAVALMGGSLQAADYPSMTIRFGDVGNRNFGYYQGMVAFKEEIESKTGGKIKVEIITDLKLGTAKDVLDAV